MKLQRRILLLGAIAVVGTFRPAIAIQCSETVLPPPPPGACAPEGKSTASGQNSGTPAVVGDWNPRESGESALAINEPMYFVVGKNDGDVRARFQFSFKYRLFDTQADGSKWTAALARLHLGYAQRSLWNLSADSKPFEDTSYRPSLFWERLEQRHDAMPDFLRYGYEHESNGQSGDDSRSIDTLFVFPAWQTRLAGRDLIVGIKSYLYLAQGSENGDIEDYRGFADLILRYGNTDGWLVAAQWQHGTANKDSLQLDLSYPVRQDFFARCGGFIFIQTFYGYGESLRTYDEKQDVNVRIGFALVR